MPSSLSLIRENRVALGVGMVALDVDSLEFQSRLDVSIRIEIDLRKARDTARGGTDELKIQVVRISWDLFKFKIKKNSLDSFSYDDQVKKLQNKIKKKKKKQFNLPSAPSHLSFSASISELRHCK